MGIDACIYFETEDGGDPVLCSTLEGSAKIVAAPDYAPKGATHEVDTFWRYYGPGYERGPWPRISAVLMELFASKNVTRVWYHGDCSDSEEVFTVEQLLGYTHMYTSFGDRAYRGYFEAIGIRHNNTLTEDK